MLWLLIHLLPYVHSLLTTFTLFDLSSTWKYFHSIVISIASVWTFSVSFWDFDVQPGF